MESLASWSFHSRKTVLYARLRESCIRMTLFAKRHYVRIARMVNRLEEPLRSKMVSEFCSVFGQDNPAFNVTKFEQACEK